MLTPPKAFSYLKTASARSLRGAQPPYKIEKYLKEINKKYK